MRAFHCSIQGASHIADNKECQDYSCTYQDEQTGVTIAIVSDGHGGDTYFRSATGSQLASEITRQAVLDFVAHVDPALLEGLPFTQEGTQATLDQESPLGEALRHLFASIYMQWRQRIEDDAQRPLTEWEIAHVSPEYQQLLSNPDRLVKVYGCTLMAYVCTPAYWFAFHIGDGKCVMMDYTGECSQPVPWDERCFLYQTTSLCDTEPVGEFRFCAQGDGTFPVAVFLGSDGLDDTFKEDDKLHHYYSTLLQHVIREGEARVLADLPDSLREYSQRGSKDDMSVACVYDEQSAESLVGLLLERSLSRLQAQLPALKDNLDDRQRKLEEAERRCHMMQKEYDYAKDQYETVQHRIAQLQEEMRSDAEQQLQPQPQRQPQPQPEPRSHQSRIGILKHQMSYILSKLTHPL